MPKNIQLKNYLKKFNNIAWYPASHLDFSFAFILRNNFFEKIGKEDRPDCLLMTDVWDDPFEKLLKCHEGDTIYNGTKAGYYTDSNWGEITIFNIKKLNNINISCDTTYYDDDFSRSTYNNVLTADLLLEDTQNRRFIIHLVFVSAETYSFYNEYLTRHKIPIKYFIYHNWGMGAEYNHIPERMSTLSTKYYLVHSAGKTNGSVYTAFDSNLDLFPPLKKEYVFYKGKEPYSTLFSVEDTNNQKLY